jgi:hypothetical protein
MSIHSPIARPLCAVLLITALASSAPADENVFGYTYGSETLPKGSSELYQWATWRTGKTDGKYDALDLQTELEHGFTDRLQGSVYLNLVQHRIAGVSGFADRDQFRFNGTQGSIKYALSSPYKDPLGVALYLEPGYTRYSAARGDRTDTYFVETKLIVQKNLLDGQLIWAANLSAEFEREHNLLGNEWESELELQLSTGVNYRFAPRWSAGVEALATSAYERMHLDELGEYAVFAGPSLHYATERWWATVALLGQLSGWPETHGARELEHFEKIQLRTKVGLNF